MRRLKRFFCAQRSQALPEFALVAVPLFVILFGIFDVGRGVIDYVTIQHAANEGGRVLAQGYPIAGSGSAYTPATTDQIVTAAIQDSGAIHLVKAPTCVNGHLPAWNSSGVPADQGYVYVSDPETTGPTTAGTLSGPDYPKGDTPAACPPASAAAASGNSPLQVTVIFHYTALLPGFLHIPVNIYMGAYSVYETEY